MKNQNNSKKSGTFSRAFILGGIAGITSYIFLRKKLIEKKLMPELSEILKEVWGDLHNTCYGNTTVFDNSEAVSSENVLNDDDIIDID